jgi:hypothetical protein
VRLLHQFRANSLELLGDGKIGATPRQPRTSMRQVPKITGHFPHDPDIATDFSIFNWEGSAALQCDISAARAAATAGRASIAIQAEGT